MDADISDGYGVLLVIVVLVVTGSIVLDEKIIQARNRLVFKILGY